MSSRENIGQAEVWNQIPGLLWTTDRELRVTSFQGKDAQRADAALQDILGKPLWETVFSPTFRDRAHRSLSGALEGRSSTLDFEWSGRMYHGHVSPLNDPEHRAVGTIGAALDVTEEIRFNEEVEGARRMELVGRIAGGVAHEFNNLLAIIQNFGYLAIEDLGIDHEASDKIRKIQTAAERGGRLVKELLAFGQRRILQPEVLDLAPTVRDLCKVVRRLVPENVELITEMSDEPGWVCLDRLQLKEIVFNLVVHACQDMRDGGQLWLYAQAKTVSPDVAKRNRGLKPGRYGIITVKDNGEGMDESVRKRIFEPFYTSQNLGKATGLGLASVFGMVKQNGGYISADCRPEKGSVYSVYFPYQKPLPHIGKKPRLSELERQSGGTILLVEDDDELRRGLVYVFTHADYKILEARDGQEALRRLETHTDTVDLLLTDLVLPGMGGRDLAKRVKTMIPDLHIIYMTGYSEETAFHDKPLESGEILLLKPVPPVTLLQKVRLLLESKGKPRSEKSNPREC